MESLVKSPLLEEVVEKTALIDINKMAEDRLLAVEKTSSNILLKIRKSLVALGVILKQGVELSRSNNINLLEAVKTTNQIRMVFSELFKSEKIGILDICKSEIFHEEKEEDVRKFLQEDFLRNLIMNFSDVLDQESIANLSEIKDIINQGKKVAFMANHISEIDPVFFDLLLRENNQKDIADGMYSFIGGVVRGEPFKNHWAKALNHVFVFSERNIADQENKEYLDRMSSFNRKSILNLRKILKKDNTSIFIHPSGKRCRPNIMNDGKYIEDNWSGNKIFKLFQLLNIDYVVPVSIFGTENINGPLSEKSGDDKKYLSCANVFCRVGLPKELSDFSDQPSDETLRSLLANEVENLVNDSILKRKVLEYFKK